MRTWPALLAALLAVRAAPAGAAQASATACSNDVFTIDGKGVGVELCAPPEGLSASKAFVIERISAHGQPQIQRQVPVDRVSGAEVSHTIDDVSLETLGVARTLHLTISVRGTTVRLEHALMIPGAVALK